MAKQIQRVAITLPPPYPWQVTVREALLTHRFVLLFSGRQIGKTEMGVFTAMDTAMQGGDVWWIAPTNRLANAGYDKLRFWSLQEPFKQFVSEYKQRRLFTFKNGTRTGTIEVISADDPATVVGGTNDLVVIDEAARMHPDAWFEGAYSTLTVRRGKALMLTNPRGKNWYWELWRRGDPANTEVYDPDYASFTFSQFDNPDLDPLQIAAQQARMSKRQYEREVLGLCSDDSGAVFVGVREAAYDPPAYPVRDSSHEYVGGIDWGSRQDYTVVTIFDRTQMRQVAVHAFTGLGWEEQWGKLGEIQSFWNCAGFDAEENSAGSVNIEMLRARGFPIRAFNTNWRSKRELIESWASAIELRQVQILRDPELILQHESMERSEESDYGTVKFFAPQGKHDDYVISSALAYRAATVRDNAAQPAFVRGKALGLYDNRAERRYPGWSSPHARSSTLNRRNARQPTGAGPSERDKRRY